MHKLDLIKENVLLKYILDLDKRGYSSAYATIKDMADFLCDLRGAPPVSKHWAYNFINRYKKLKTRFIRAYDY